ncbi:MAG: hypothetical protein ACFFG0_18575 [Candidatus Thorarchaeota archaeon]
MKNKKNAWELLYKNIENPTEIDVILAAKYLCHRLRCVLRSHTRKQFKLENSIFPYIMGIFEYAVKKAGRRDDDETD